MATFLLVALGAAMWFVDNYNGKKKNKEPEEEEKAA